VSASKISLVRRRLLAVAAALAASGKWALAVDNPRRAGPLNPQTPAAAGENRLYLPNANGGAVRMKFAPSPAWARDTPGWYVPDTTSAGVGIFDFATRPADRIAIKLKSFRELPILLAEAKSLGTDTIYLVESRRQDDKEAKDYFRREFARTPAEM
jgi:hypothetical protein